MMVIQYENFLAYYHILCLGLQALHTHIHDPSTCSIQTCETSPGWVEAAWVTRQKFSGCDCCIAEGKMIPDGFSWTVGKYPVETWECCRGKIVRVMEGTKTKLTNVQLK